MPQQGKVKVGIIGSQFEADIHAASFQIMPEEAEVVAVASPTPGHPEALAQKYGIPRVFHDYRKLLDEDDIEMVTIAAPNYLHARLTVEVANAGKHVVCEKPLCMTLEEADEMIDVCRRQGVLLLYAEELFFTPKYVQAKKMADEGAFGKVYLVKQSEKHSGPHAAWFWDVRRSGGGVTFDMGCHAFEFFRWMLGKPPVESVYADMGTYVHREKTAGDDNSLIIVKFDGGVTGLAEESWAKPGGMDDCAEVHGSEGVAYADLLQGNSILTYSKKGPTYAVEKASTTAGWSFTIFEEIWNYGFPQEFEHFVDCVRNDKPPLEAGEDGRAVLEMVFAAYESAREGRRIALPFPTDAEAPIELWRRL